MYTILLLLGAVLLCCYFKLLVSILGISSPLERPALFLVAECLSVRLIIVWASQVLVGS